MKKLLLLLCLPLSIYAQNIRINQVGYETKGPKMAVIEDDVSLSFTSFEIVTTSGQPVYSGTVQPEETVNGWTGRHFQTLDFSDLQETGTFKVKVDNLESETFEIGDNLLFDKMAFSVVDFFYNMRHVETNDQTISFNGTRSDVVDLSGGWFDATGDPGKHMSHLSYANHFNPQQIPMVAWSLMEAYELDNAGFQGKMADLTSEIEWGIDYLMRNHDDEGYFYLAIFDDWGNAPFSREVCEWGVEGNNAGRTDNYQCAMREGGGMAIAALAKANRLGFTAGGFTSTEILQIAEESFAHLRASDPTYGTVNEAYCNDHTENIIDDYCGLMAAIELYKATNNASYLTAATEYYGRLVAKQQPDGWFASDVAGNRPFYHAADEGLPIVALIKYMEIEPSAETTVIDALTSWINWYKTITAEVSNPFNYVRQYHKPYADGSLGAAKKAFFLPHDNETGYWWQGENARLSSMTTAFLQASKVLDNNFSIENNENGTLAVAQLDWICGRNPFNLCMVTGFGHQNYPVYKNGDTYSTNHVGGICNGITAMDSDENDIEWAPYDNGGGNGWMNWRWVEQWLPHDAWFLLAVSSLSKTIKESGGITSRPIVTITNPSNGDNLTNGIATTITATVTDTSALISTVEFIVNGTSIGFDTEGPYEMGWTPSVGGNNTIAVKAYNSNGITSTSSIAVAVDGQGPYDDLIQLPGTFEAEDYDTGGEGVAYHDTGAGNQTGAYRSDDVDIESASEGGFNIGYIETDEWLEYTVSVAATGNYDFEYRIAAGLDGGELHAELDGNVLANSTVNVLSTGGWQNWQTFTASDVQLQEGIHVLRIYFDAGPLNLNSITVISKVEDCNGVLGGAAFYDNCNTCVGGTTGNEPCDVDCSGEWGGTAEVDECDVCAGGNTGIVPGESCEPEEDCAGVPGGSAYTDACGNCVGGTTGNTTVDTNDDGEADCIDNDDDGDGVDDGVDCEPLNAAVGASSSWYADNDGDGLGDPNESVVDCYQPTGYVSNNNDTNDDDFDNDGIITSQDCDDTNASIGVATTWYLDSDDDGLGTASTSVAACSQPANYVDNADDNNDDDFDNDNIITSQDCDDTNASIGVATTWYEDNDDDGLGNPSSTLDACDQPTGYVANNNDTNDNDGDNDGVETPVDCDDNNTGIGTATTWYADTDNDGLGDENNSVQACDQPVGFVANFGDECPNDENKLSPGICGCGTVDVDADNDGECDNTDTDLDNDGVPNDTDCEPTNPNVGAADTWYADLDNDGLGNPSSSITSCTQPTNYVSNNNDSNDNDADNDGVETEEDCDDGNPADSQWNTVYLDNDEDEFGDPNNSIEICEMHFPLGTETYVFDNTDCDDNNSSIYPGAEEILNDGIDQDCDGSDKTVITALPEYIIESVKISPNPFESGFTVELSGDFEVSVYDVAGVLVHESKETDFALLSPNVSAGIYFVRVTSSTVDEIVKVVKQ